MYTDPYENAVYCSHREMSDARPDAEILWVDDGQGGGYWQYAPTVAVFKRVRFLAATYSYTTLEGEELEVMTTGGPRVCVYTHRADVTPLYMSKYELAELLDVERIVFEG